MDGGGGLSFYMFCSRGPWGVILGGVFLYYIIFCFKRVLGCDFLNALLQIDLELWFTVYW